MRLEGKARHKCLVRRIECHHLHFMPHLQQPQTALAHTFDGAARVRIYSPNDMQQFQAGAAGLGRMVPRDRGSAPLL